MPALPFAKVDILVVDAIGKNISGAGIDPNVIGRGMHGERMRMCHDGEYANTISRDLTPESTATRADRPGRRRLVTSRRRPTDPVVTYTNALAAMKVVPARIPFHFATDTEFIRAALRLAGVDPDTARICGFATPSPSTRCTASSNYLAEINGRTDSRGARRARALAVRHGLARRRVAHPNKKGDTHAGIALRYVAGR